MAIPKEVKEEVARIQRGRPSIWSERLKNIMIHLAKEGKTDNEIAKICDLDEVTFRLWKSQKANFLLALKESKSIPDQLVEVSLFRRATGYSHKETKVFCNSRGEVTTFEVEKVYPPDTVACIFWLKNRQPEKWRDKQEVVHSNEDDHLTAEQLRAKIAAMLMSRKAKSEPEEREVNAAQKGLLAKGDESKHQD